MLPALDLSLPRTFSEAGTLELATKLKASSTELRQSCRQTREAIDSSVTLLGRANGALKSHVKE